MLGHLHSSWIVVPVVLGRMLNAEELACGSQGGEQHLVSYESRDPKKKEIHGFYLN